MIHALAVDPRPPHATAPLTIAQTGATMARVVLTPDFDLSVFRDGCRALGVEVLPVIARESLTDWDAGWELPEYIWALSAYRHPGGVDWNGGPIQIGNEPDLESDSSWTMAPEALNRLIWASRSTWPKAQLVGPGLASGDASYLEEINLRELSAIAAHPYGRRAPGYDLPREYADLVPLLESYRHFGKPLWITEYGAPAQDFDFDSERARYYAAMATYLASADVEVACAFCLEGVDAFRMTYSTVLGTWSEAVGEPPLVAGRILDGLGGFRMLDEMTVRALAQTHINARGAVIGNLWGQKPVHIYREEDGTQSAIVECDYGKLFVNDRQEVWEELDARYQNRASLLPF